MEVSIVVNHYEDDGDNDIAAADPEDDGDNDIAAADPEDDGDNDIAAADPEDDGDNDIAAADPEDDGDNDIAAADPEGDDDDPDDNAGIGEDIGGSDVAFEHSFVKMSFLTKRGSRKKSLSG